MSFDLLVWKEPVVTTEEEAGPLVQRFYESENPTVFTRSDDLLRFHDKLMDRYPALESFSDNDTRSAQAPWSETPDRSDRLIVLSMRWGTPDAMLEAIVELARQHELVLYDPQGPSLHLPAREDEPADIAGQVRQAWKAGAFGLLLILAGTLIPFRILSWPIGGVGLVLVLMTVYTLVVLWKPEWQPR